jgi:hypothetical protein
VGEARTPTGTPRRWKRTQLDEGSPPTTLSFAVSSVAPTTSCPIPATSSTCTCLGARELATDTRLCGINDVERLPIKFGALTAGNVRNDLSWTLVGQSAQAVRDNDLLDTVSACEGDTAGQLKWLKTRMKQAAPQVLVVAEA